jgi:hypothetical protein
MKKTVKLIDSVTTNDILNFNNNTIKTGFDTDVIIRSHNSRKDGSEIEVRHNKTVLPGRTHLLETIFPVTPKVQGESSQHLFLNDNVLGEYDVNGVSISNPLTVGKVDNDGVAIPNIILPRYNMNLFRRRKVEYWCAGNGAFNKTFGISSYPAHITDTCLFDMIPFRFVPNDALLDDNTASQYKFKVQYPVGHEFEGYTGYYFKKIKFADMSNGIDMKVDGQPYVPKWGDTRPNLENIDVTNYDGTAEDQSNDQSAGGINGYQNQLKGNKTQTNSIDMELNITSIEFKEYFAHIGAGSDASISEIGLVLGNDCFYDKTHQNLVLVDDLPMGTADEISASTIKKIQSEVFDAELFAHLTFDPYPVSRENATIDFTYRIYS